MLNLLSVPVADPTYATWYPRGISQRRKGVFSPNVYHASCWFLTVSRTTSKTDILKPFTAGVISARSENTDTHIDHTHKQTVVGFLEGHPRSF